MFLENEDKNHSIFETMKDLEKDINNDELSNGKKSILYMRLVGLRNQFEDNKFQSFETIKINGNRLTDENFRLVQLYCLQQSLSVMDFKDLELLKLNLLPKNSKENIYFQSCVKKAVYYKMAEIIRKCGSQMNSSQAKSMMLTLQKYSRGFDTDAAFDKTHAVKVLHNLSVFKALTLNKNPANIDFNKLLTDDDGDDLMPKYYVEDFENVKEKVRTNRSSFFSWLRIALS